MNRFSKISLVAASCLALAACSRPVNTSADKMEQEQTAQLAAAAAREVPVPAITNFYEKHLLAEIYERRDQADLGTYAYVQGLDGRLTCLGRSMGYGVPYSTQFVNPQRRSGSLVLPQPEPNGLFIPDGMSATWLQLVTPDGDVEVVYVEPTIVVSPFPIQSAAVAVGC